MGSRLGRSKIIWIKIIIFAKGNRYTVPNDSESTLVLGEDALNRANELVNERELEKDDIIKERKGK